MRIRGMNVRLNLGRVVEQNVKNIMAFVFVRPDDTGIDGDMVGDKGVGDNAFFKTEIFR